MPSCAVGQNRNLSLADLKILAIPVFKQNQDQQRSPNIKRKDLSVADSQEQQQQQHPKVDVMTASLQSINRLADSVENLRDKLAAHAGMQLFQTRVAAMTKARMMEKFVSTPSIPYSRNYTYILLLIHYIEI